MAPQDSSASGKEEERGEKFPAAGRGEKSDMEGKKEGGLHVFESAGFAHVRE